MTVDCPFGLLIKLPVFWFFFVCVFFFILLDIGLTAHVLAGKFSMLPKEPIRWAISCGLDLTAGGPRAVPSTSSRT